MAYFKDLSEYSYLKEARRSHTVNVGWLERWHRYTKQTVSEEIAQLLWNFCKISIAQTRGFHVCNLCDKIDWLGGQVIGTLARRIGCFNAWRPNRKLEPPLRACRGEESLVLGSAEIRVFGKGDTLFAAPNLIYHYVINHHYKMPDEFVAALKGGPSPEDPEYLARLGSLGLKWHKTGTAIESADTSLSLNFERAVLRLRKGGGLK
jgi:hypothetical protein